MPALLAGHQGGEQRGPRSRELGPVQEAALTSCSPPPGARGEWSRVQAAPRWTGSEAETAL